MRLTITFLLVLAYGSVFGTMVTSNGDGNWNVGSTWVGGVPPGATDSVTIQSGHDIIVTADASCGVIQIDGNSNTTTLTVNASQTLTCTRLHILPSGTNQTVNLTVNGAINVSNGFQCWDNGNSGSVLNITGSGRISATGYVNFWATGGLTVNVGATLQSNTQLYLATTFGNQVTVDVTDSIILYSKTIFQSIYGSHSSSNTVLDMDNASGVLYFPSTMAWQFIGTGGEIQNSASGGRTVYDNLAAYSSDSRFQYDDIVVNANNTLTTTKSFSNTNVFGNLIIESGVSLSAGSTSLDIGCGVSNSGTLTSGATGTVNFNGTALQTISGGGTFNLYTVTSSNASGVTYSGTDTMDINSNLVISSGTFSTSGRVRLMDSGSGMANLGQVDGAISGNIICQFRSNTLTNVDYRHISSPVAGLTIGNIQYNATSCEECFYTWGFTGANTASGSPASTFTYNNSNMTGSGNFDDGWVTATNSTNSISHNNGTIFYIGPGSGSFNRSSYNFEAVGAANTGTTLINAGSGANMAYDAANAGDNNYNWCLIGNPYPSATDWTLVNANTNTSNVEAVMYIYSPDGGGWVASNSGGNANIIPAFQGFMIRSSGSNAAVEFQENDKTTTQRAYQKSIMDEERIYFRLTNVHTPKYNWGSIRFNANATPSYDQDIDALHLQNPYPSPNVAALTPDMEELQVYSTSQHLPHLEIPLKTMGYFSDTYTLHLTNPDGIEGCFVLEDKFENKMIPFQSDSLSYSFQLNDSNDVARFVLHVYNMAEEVNVENSSCSGENDGSVALELYNDQLQHNVFLLDDNNQVIGTEFAVSKSVSFSDLKPGNYTIQIDASGLTCPTIEEFFTVFEPGAMSPDFEFAGDSLIFHVNEEISFDNLSKGAIATYHWDFGDQNTSMEMIPTHVYQEAGIYKVALTVSNGNDDCNMSKERFIQVNENHLGQGEWVDHGPIQLRGMKDHVLVVSDQDALSGMNYQFLDVSGKVLSEGTLDSGERNEKVAIPHSNGLIIFVLKSGDETHHLKLVR
ncbi:PKD domain-containing protein [bacterium SCSIO 12741]|nr:PKD domain-containing protein [bacterium SCSIO 12741]